MTDYFDAENGLQIKSENIGRIKNTNDIKRRSAPPPKDIFQYHLPDPLPSRLK